MGAQYVNHSDLLRFSNEKVNIPREYLSEYRGQVKRLKEKLEEYIAEHPDYDLAKFYHSGSVAKGTALKTLNDMDVAVYVKKTDRFPTDEKLIQWLMDRLIEAYKNVLNKDQFSPGTHCVRISFRGSGLDVDVSPVIYEGDVQNKGYLINKNSGKRVLTSIPMHLEFMRIRKKKSPQHYRQVIRLIKWWNKEKKRGDENFRFKSFMIELICAKLLDDGVDFKDYVKAIETFFIYILKSGLKDRIYFTDNYSVSALPKDKCNVIEIFDPVNPANNIAALYDEEARQKIINAAQDSLDAMNEAMFTPIKSKANELWQSIFGPSFKV